MVQRTPAHTGRFEHGGNRRRVVPVRREELRRHVDQRNCDTQGNIPPPDFAPVVELARQGALAEAVKDLANDFALARSEAGFGSGYERPQDLSDEVLHAYLAPLAESDLRASELQRCVAQLEPGPLLAVEPQLKELETPTLLVWGTGDPLFDLSWARWLRDTIPGVTEIVEIEGAKLFFPDERAADLVPHLRRHWEATAEASYGDGRTAERQLLCREGRARRPGASAAPQTAAGMPRYCTRLPQGHELACVR
ncbi:MAG: alpha/beta fold hydrolase [Acidimicrobiales bacterium]